MSSLPGDPSYWSSDAFCRYIVESGFDGIWVIDAEHDTVFVNSRMGEILGYPPEEMLGHTPYEFMCQEGIQIAEDNAARRRDGEIERMDFKLRKKDHSVVWAAVESKALYDDDGHVAGWLKLVTDISPRAKAEDALRRREQQLSTAEQLADLGSWSWDVGSDRITWSDELFRIYGRSPATNSLTFHEFMEYVHEDDRERVRTVLKKSVRTSTPFHFSKHIVRPDGSLRQLSSRGRVHCDAEGKLQQLVGVCMDVTEQMEGEERLQYVIYHDAVTGLQNRYVLQEKARGHIERARRAKRSSALIMLDIDWFKTINESLGHPTGDKLLLEVAGRLKAIVNAGDLLIHNGGDEFLLLLKDFDDAETATRMATRILDEIAEPMRIDERNFRITTSIGIARYPDDGDNITALMQCADVALARAKKAGRNRFQLYSATMSKDAENNLRITHDLEGALENNEFFLMYQPRVNLHNGKVTGVEALIRWHPPGRDIVSPLEFIPIAEETGQIVPIGLWVLRTACTQAMAWRSAGMPRIRMAINVSTRQQLDKDFVEQVRTVVRDTGFPPADLELEITESMSMQEGNGVQDMLEALAADGITICVDDFGMGYSSLARLMNLPIGVVKIDRSFISNVPADDNSMAITEAIVTLARRRNLQTIAEGVETPVQLAALRELGCEDVQGFLFSRPLLSDALWKFVMSGTEAQRLQDAYSGNMKILSV